MSNRIYSEDEVTKLIRRAVELEAGRSVSNEKQSGKGLTLQEIEQVASETGIDPELIKQAASELDNKSSGNLKDDGKINITKSEIVSERWIDARPDRVMFEDLVTELNHRYGTSEEGNWWDRLWDNYAGRAKVEKTATTVDWNFTDEMEFYTTRVLMQRRGEKFRIRVSKRVGWSMSWSSKGGTLFVSAMIFLVSVLIGGSMGFALFDSPIAGILAGAGFTALTIPAMLMWEKQWIKKHKEEVAETTEALASLALQMASESGYQENKTAKRNKPGTEAIEIEIPESENRQSDEAGGLRNNLREKI